MSKWFRWHEGTCEDGKFRVVARNAGVTVATVMGVWAILLEDASHDDHRGIAVRGEDFYAAILDLGSELKPILEAMQNIGLIACCTNDTIEISNWSKRQYETDTVDATNAERQRRFREKHKSNANQTKRNGSVTATKRPETEADTDTDKITEAKASGAVAPRMASPASVVTEPEVYRLGRDVLGKSCGGVITSLRKHCRQDLREVRDLLEQARDKGNAMEWVQGVLRGTESAKMPMHQVFPEDVYRNVL